MLEFVRDDAHVVVGSGRQRYGVYVDYLAAVAVGMHGGREFVFGAEVAGGAV